MVIAGVISDLTDWLEDVSAEWWFLLVILAIAFLDSVIPIVPSETTVILGGVAAGAGDQNLLLVIPAAPSARSSATTRAYLIGRRFRPLIERRAARREKTAQRLEWADATDPQARRAAADHRPLHPRRADRAHHHVRPDPPAVGVVRRLGGHRRRRSGRPTPPCLGYMFGSTLEDNHTLAFLLAFGAALSVTLIIEVVRHQRGKRARATTTASRPRCPDVP